MSNVPNIFALGQDAYKDAYSTQQAITDDRAKIVAGRKLATGDYQGGAATLNSAGLIDQAHNVVADQEILADRQQIAQGRAQQQEEAHKQAQLAGLLKVTDALQAVPEGQRHNWLMTQAPTFQQLGLPADALANASEEQLSNAALAPWKAALGKAAKLHFITQGANTVAVDDQTGAVKQTYRGPLTVKKDETIYEPDDPAAPPAAAAPGAAPAVSPTSAPVKVSPQDRDQLARMIATEAGGEGPQGMAAVAHVALNRLKSGYGGATSLSGVVNAPNQFEGMSRAAGVSPKMLQAAQGIADQVLSGQIPDPTNGADQFLNPVLQAKLGRSQPAWADGSGQRIGNHVFYGAGKQIAQAGAQGSDTLKGSDAGDAPAPKGYHLLASGPSDPEEAPLSPDGVALVGAQYLRFGPDALKNMGQGKAGVHNKNAIMEWVAKTAKEAGTSNPELVARFANNKANQAALTQNTKMLTAISASEHTLDKNLDYAMTFAKAGVGPTGVPLLDTPINKLRTQLGSTDAKNLDNLLTTTGNEYAKILSSATGTGGATSDSARAEAQHLIHSGMTLRQLTDAVKIAKQEAENRRASYVSENSRLSSEISGMPQKPDAPTPPPAAPPRARPPLSAIFR